VKRVYCRVKKLCGGLMERDKSAERIGENRTRVVNRSGEARRGGMRVRRRSGEEGSKA
jgi:hypothetical protein